MERLKSLLLLFLASATFHAARGEDASTFTNLHEYIERTVQESIQRALSESDEKHAVQIASMREENELRIHQVKDELSKKHADDMVAMRNEFETHIRDLNRRLEMVANTIESEVNNADGTAKALKTSPGEIFANTNRTSGVPKSSHRATGRIRKSKPSSRINSSYFSRSRQGDNALRRTSRQENEGTRVAFFAGMDATNHNLGQNDDIVFEQVHTNIGNAYNSHHGIFIAPVDGVYVFSCTLENLNAHTRAHMIVNGAVVANFDMDPNNNLQSSHTIVVSLKKGHDVSVQNSVLARTILGGHYSTFSGFLLYEDFSNTPIIVG